MHEINNINKRLRTVKHFSNYILIALVIIVLTTLLVLAAEGYDIDRSTGKVIQNGIILIESEPAGATVSINGVPEPNTSPARYPVPEGSYQVKMELEGYRPWEANVTVLGSQVSWIYYPLLVPSSISTSTVTSVNNLNFVAQNPERDTLAVAQDTNIKVIRLYDLGASKLSPTQLVIPNSVLNLEGSQAVGAISYLDWSPGGRWLMLDYRVGGQNDFVLVDVNDRRNSLNLDKTFGREFEAVVLADDDKTAYLLSGGRVFRANLDTKTLSIAIADNVASVVTSPSGDWIITKQATSSSLSDINQPEISILEIDDEVVDVVAGESEGQSVVVLQYADVVEIYRSLNRSDSSKNLPEKIIKLGPGAKSIAISPEGRFVSVVKQSNTVIYDIETRLTYRVDHGIDEATQWLDGYRLLFGRGTQLYVADFSGDNEYQIGGYLSEHGAFINEHSDAIYSVSASSVGNGLLLRESSLTAN